MDTLTRLVGAIRALRGELLFIGGWVLLLAIAQRTSRTPELVAGSLCIVLVLGLVHWISGMRDTVARLERERAAEIAEAVQPPRVISEAERRQCEAIRSRIALAIRGQGAHLREG